jgi:hypothetical protein
VIVFLGVRVRYGGQKRGVANDKKMWRYLRSKRS